MIMSQTCATQSCSRPARALCYCCGENLCIIHLNEHNDMLNNRLNPLAEMISSLNNRMEMIDMSKIAQHYRGKLEQWRAESHRKVDEYFEQKSHQLNEIITEKLHEQREKIHGIQLKISHLLHEQQVTQEDIHHLTSIVDHLDKEMNTIKENFIDIRTQPLTLDNQMINIRAMNEEDYDLTMLSPVYKLINLPDGSFGAMASNDRCLLIHQAPDLCLIGPDLMIFKRIAWRYGMIHDMCWSTILDRFILIDPKNIFLLDEYSMSIEKIRAIDKRKWMSCTCSDKFLFLSSNEWGSSITKISLNPSKKLDKQWQSPSVCGKDEYIDVIVYHHNRLAMIVRNSTNHILRMELRSAENLDRIWSLPLDLKWNVNKPYHCCAFIGDDWLVADYQTGRLIHITRSGRIKSTTSYNTIPSCITRFSSNILAVSTKNAIHFHELNYQKSYTIFIL